MRGQAGPTHLAPLIPVAIQRSRLMEHGGVAVYDGLVNPGVLEHLAHEASAQQGQAEENHEPRADCTAWRGGSPARRFLTAAGGELQRAFYQAPEILEALSSLCGVPVSRTGECGTFTYYIRPGDHLALHRDIETCDLAVITCLIETCPEGTSGAVAVYPERLHDPLPAIRETPDRGRQLLQLLPGQTLLLYGGIVPHEITPVASGQERVVSVLCYRAVTAVR